MFFAAVTWLVLAAEQQCNETKYPRVQIGCWQLLERNVDQNAAVATLKAYTDAGFTAFDTADIYGPSESILGKLRAELGSAVTPKIFTKYVTREATEEEARRINSQSRTALGAVPDMVQFHWWDYSDGRFVDAAKHLVTLQGEGLLGEVAACNFDTPHLRTMVEAGVPIVANQVQYSLLDRRPETAMLAYAKAQGIRLATFGTVAGGLLSDKFLDKPAHWHPPGRKTVSMRMYRPHLDRWSGGDWNLFQELLRTLRAIADKHTHSDHVQTIATVASAWVLHQLGPDGGWVIIGVRDDSHLIEHKALRDLVLDAEDAAKINEVLAKGAAPVGDIWSYERGG